MNTDGCTIEYIDFPTKAPTLTQAPKTECDYVDRGVCIQSCIRGGCSLKCLNSDKYHSCEQSCTGKFQNALYSCLSCQTTLRGWRGWGGGKDREGIM